jgi:ketosteroid isomerase-like protein
MSSQKNLHRRALLVLAVAALFLPHTGPATEPSVPRPTAQDQEFLDQYRVLHARAVRDGTPDVIARFFSDTIRLMPSYHGTIFGKADAMKYHYAFAERLAVRDYTRTPVEFMDLDTRVLEVGRFAMKAGLKNGGDVHELAGKYVDVWVKLPAGGLALSTSAWNADAASKIDDHLRFRDAPGIQIALQAHVPVKDNISFELAALNKLHEAAVAEGNATVWSLFFADDAIVAANFGALLRGRKEVDAYIQEHASALPVFEKLDIRNDQIDHLGKFVIEHASHIANWRNGDASGVNTGKNLRVWRREPDGSLKLILQIGMYD